MKNFKKCLSLLIYGLCGLIVVLSLQSRFCQINSSSQNPLALSRLCNFLRPSFRMERPSGVILIRRIGLNTPSCELKLRIRASPPERGTQKVAKSRLSLDLPEKVVCLKGKLILKLFPGPPEYYSVEDGDRPDYCWILQLDETSFLKAITTPVADPANMLDNIKKRPGADEVLLVLDEHMKDFCQKNQSQEIVSEGYLFHAHTAHHYTPILMDVKELKIVGTEKDLQEVYPDSNKRVNFDPCKRNPKVWIPSGREVGAVAELKTMLQI